MEVLARGQILVHAEEIGDVADLFANEVRLRADIQPHDLRATLIRRLQRGQHADRRGLAGPIRTDEPEHFSRRNLERDPFHRFELAVLHSQVGNINSQHVNSPGRSEFIR